MSGEYIKIKTHDNKEFSGYLSKPPSGREGPGLIIIQEIFGVNSHIRDVADLYAQEGFVALAPDLFWRAEPGVELGYDAKGFTKGMELRNKLDTHQTIADLTSTKDTLHHLPSVSGKTGAVGFCFGGLMAYHLACHSLVDAAVSYYGGSIEKVLDEAKSLKTPLLMHFGELDKHIPFTTIQSALAKKPNVTIYTYPGADHGFNCDQRATYNRQAAMLAYGRSAAFLHKHLN